MGYHPKGSNAHAEEIFNICKKNGWSTNAICGMLGNLSWESYLNPTEGQQGGGGGYGLAQWPYSTLEQYAQQCGVSDFTTIPGQIAIIIDQMSSGGGGQYLYNENHPSYWIQPSTFITSNASVTDLTYSWLYNYERAGVDDSYYRVKGAQFWYEYFTTNNSGNNSSSGKTVPQFNGPIPGVDVSDDNEWVGMGALSDAGIKIVYIQTTNGETEYTFTNSQNQTEYFSEAYYQTAKQNGLYVGVYHFAVNGEGTPQEQAKVFYNAIKNYDLDCIPMVDIESSGGFDMGNDSEVQNWFQSFADEFTSLSKLPIGIYATRSALNNTFSSSFSQYPIWVANWLYSPQEFNSLILPSGSTFPGSLSNWSNWNGWQWGVCSPAPGYSLGGGIDLDVFNESIFLSAQNNYIPSGSSNSNGGSSTSGSTEITYTVEAGNTLSGIAEKYNVTVGELCKWNNISDPNDIYIGEQIIIYTSEGGSSSSEGSNNGGATTGIVNITSGTLNVRAGAGFNWPVIGSLYPGQTVTLGPVIGDWYNIYFGQHGGFVYAPYITTN